MNICDIETYISKRIVDHNRRAKDAHGTKQREVEMRNRGAADALRSLSVWIEAQVERAARRG